MADNKEDLNVSVEVETINANYETAKKELNDLDEGKFYEKHEDGKASGKISGKLNKAKENIFTEFKNKNEGIEAKSLDELDEESRKKYDEFLKNSEEVQKIYDEVDKEVKEINKDRNVALREVGQKIDNLAIEIEKKLEETETNIKKNKEAIENKQKEIDALKPEDFENEELFKAKQKELLDEMSKLNDEKSTLENDKKRLEHLQEEITRKVTKEQKQQARENGQKIPEDGLRQQLQKSLDNQKLVRAGAQEAAKEIFGEDRVKDDFGLSDLDKEDIEKENAAKENQQQQQQEAPAQGKGQKAEFVPEQAIDNTAAQVIEEEKEPKELSYADILGYDLANKLTYNSAQDVINVFLGNKESPAGIEMTDENKIALLNNPEAVKMLQNAIMKVNSKDEGFIKNLLHSRSTKKMNKQLDKLVNKTLPEFSKQKIENINKEDKQAVIKDIGSDFGLDLNGNVQEQLNNISDPNELAKIGKAIQAQEENYEIQIADLNKKLKSNDLSQEELESIKSQKDALENKKKIFETIACDPYSLSRFKDISANAMEKRKESMYSLDSAPKVADKENQDFLNTLTSNVKDRDEAAKEDIKRNPLAIERDALDAEIQTFYENNPGKDLSKDLRNRKEELDAKVMESAIAQKDNGGNYAR